MMAPMIENIFGVVFVVVIFLRIFLLRPHWLGNIVSFIAMMIIMLYGEMNVSGSESWIGIAVGCAAWVLLLHFLAKWYDKRRATKKAKNEAANQNKAEPQPKPQTPIQPSKPPQPKPQPKPKPKQKPAPVLVEQTLTHCVCCKKQLYGPKCTNCNFDYTSDSILLLCKIEPEKLQIRVER